MIAWVGLLESKWWCDVTRLSCDQSTFPIEMQYRIYKVCRVYHALNGFLTLWSVKIKQLLLHRGLRDICISLPHFPSHTKEWLNARWWCLYSWSPYTRNHQLTQILCCLILDTLSTESLFLRSANKHRRTFQSQNILNVPLNTSIEKPQ